MKLLLIVTFLLLWWSVDGFRKCGAGECQCGSSEVIDGADFNTCHIAIVDRCCGCGVAAKLNNEAMIGYYDVDFKDGYKAIVLEISNGSPDSNIPMIAYFYIDEPYGTPIATLRTQRICDVGDWCTFVRVKVCLTTCPTGIHNLFIVSSTDPDPRIGVFNLKSFCLTNDC